MLLFNSAVFVLPALQEESNTTVKDGLRERLSETEGESQPGDCFIADTIQETGMTRELREQECFTDRGRYNERTIGECFYCYCSSAGIDFKRRKERETVVSKCCHQRQRKEQIERLILLAAL